MATVPTNCQSGGPGSPGVGVCSTSAAVRLGTAEFEVLGEVDASEDVKKLEDDRQEVCDGTNLCPRCMGSTAIGDTHYGR